MADLDRSLYGDPLVEGYSVTQANGFYKKSVFRGNARFRLRDSFPTSRVTVNWVWDSETFVAFKTFWSDDLNYGKEWFGIWLMLGTYEMGTNFASYQAHATGSFSATKVEFGNWRVVLPLEVIDAV